MLPSLEFYESYGNLIIPHIDCRNMEHRLHFTGNYAQHVLPWTERVTADVMVHLLG
jgi:hypothetical protein